MKITKHFSFDSKKQIWRILISDSNKLILETRDMHSKEVYFQCFELSSGKKVFSDFQFEEKSWIGIEAIHDDIMYLHKYVKPDMPIHKGIIAFDVNAKKVLWKNENLSFLFAYEKKVYCFKQGFDERDFYILDSSTGNLLDELENDYHLIDSIREKSEAEKNRDDYLYPEIFIQEDEEEKKIINNICQDFDTSGDIEFISNEGMVMFNVHKKKKNDVFDNCFFVVNKYSGKILFEEILNAGVSSLYTDSFFIYKNFLFLLKEKNEIKIFTLE
jgi:hypothetical protein